MAGVEGQGTSIFFSNDETYNRNPIEYVPSLSSYDSHTEGYDNIFVPHPDPKYECPICLLILKEPLQTECGHRFCKHCLFKWLREEKSTCPVDNEPIHREALFPDNFAKREILALSVRCPNNKQGCDSIVVLKQLDHHLELCPMALEPCPNYCSGVFLRWEIPDHISEKCPKRKVSCSDCNKEMYADELEAHHRECPSIRINCQFCDVELIRDKMKYHLDKDCAKALVKCPFYNFGCKTELERATMTQHSQDSTQAHLDMLGQCMSHIVTYFPHLQDLVQQTPGATAMPPENRAAMEMTAESFPLSAEIRGLHIFQDPRSPPASSQSLNQNECRASTMMFQSAEHEGLQSPRPPPNKSGTWPLARDNSTLMSVAQHSNNSTTLSLRAGFSSVSDQEFQSLKDRNTYQDESLADHEQRLTDMHAKMMDLEKANKELKQKVKLYEDKWPEYEGRACNGHFLWKIKNYNRLRQEAETGQTTVLHSVPFFTNFYGYKLCLRTNLNGVESAQGTHLSIFIHFMQGEFDDILDWPFNGKIILTVLDQNPVSEIRHHISETLISKPNLAAFQKPKAHRNHKGFGYMEFIPLGILDNSTYVRNDTLIIRAQVVTSN